MRLSKQLFVLWLPAAQAFSTLLACSGSSPHGNEATGPHAARAVGAATAATSADGSGSAAPVAASTSAPGGASSGGGPQGSAGPQAAAPASGPDAGGEPPPLPAGTKVLHVGDSMADALGKDLHRELVARGVKSFLKAKEATYIPEWAGWTMGLKNLLLQHQPDLVIVTLGGNEVAMPDPTIRAEPVRKIVEMIGDRPCIWIGAPLWGPHTGILKVIRESCSPCIYVDTNALIPDLERLSDNVHPTLPERKRWAKFMIDWLARHRDPHGKRPWDLRTDPTP